MHTYHNATWAMILQMNTEIALFVPERQKGDKNIYEIVSILHNLLFENMCSAPGEF
jgi:hypothetical protein